MKKIVLLILLLTLTGCKSIDIFKFNNKEEDEFKDVSKEDLLKSLENTYDYKALIKIYKNANDKNRIVGGVINPLTGLYIEKEFENVRPTAVVFNNLSKALPQSGISESDVYYEVLAEGGITRIIGISHKFKCEKIGPIRSTRDYFIKFALDNDAIFVHHGGSPQGYEYIQNNGINNLDGMQLEGITFYRDKDRARERGLEHSSYTSGQGIEEARERYNYTENIKPGFISSFVFNDENQLLNSDNNGVKEIILPYSNEQKSRFVYNEDEKVYYRFQGDNKHMDEFYDQQIAVKNLLVQYAETKTIDDIGRREITLTGSGSGFYFTNGEFIAVKWKKDSDLSPTKWYHEDGNELLINKGKTWISVFSKNENIGIVEKDDQPVTEN